MVANTYERYVVDVHVAEDTTHAEHVLTFEVRAVAPAHYLHRQTVLARAEILGDVEFVVVVRTLRIAHIFAVQVDEGGTVNTSEIDERAVLLPALGQFEEADIRTDGIDAVVLSAVVEALTRVNIRWRIAVRILHVAIDGTVVAVHFPIGRHGNGRPTADVIVLLVEVGRTQRRFGHEVEVPVAVQRAHLVTLGVHPRSVIEVLVAQHTLLAAIRGVGGMTFLLVLAEHGLVLPIHLLALNAFAATRNVHTARNDAEKSGVSLCQIGFGFNHDDGSVFLYGSHPFRLVGRFQTDVVACPYDAPQLELVGAIHLYYLSSSIVIRTHGKVVIRIGEPLAARQVAHLPQLVLVFFVNRFEGNLCHPVGIAPCLVGMFHGYNLIEFVLVIRPRGCRQQHRQREQERSGQVFHKSCFIKVINILSLFPQK